MSWTVKSSKGRSQDAQILKMVYSECIHAIWLERNLRIFETVNYYSFAKAL
ncbi:hypothetical protein R3W88_008871 [Solanum pinnatisectum]|uniref:Uncharacterized protein n=1 Tax=Solanum pinnatisectum TaxID=50273 RepID=A0AAV9MC43_9SOLN|nr:hypothetical protein R3W88_008871 [Solanum pinnatisectum]